MRAFIPNIIKESEIPVKLTRQSWDSPVVNKIVDKCSHLFDKPVKRDAPSYMRLESRTTEHPWHVDTGTKNHMMWCIYGISVLVGKPKKGGLFKYKDPDKEYAPEDRYLGAAVHTSDEWHMRESSGPGHKAILIFLAEDN